MTDPQRSEPLDWVCEDCVWAWPLPTDPPTGAECDSCGGRLVAEPCDCEPAPAVDVAH